MRSPLTPKRLALAAAAIGATLGATPALAQASSTCEYNTFNRNLIVADRSGEAPLKIFRTPAGEIRISDGLSSSGFACFIPNTAGTANLTNTERVAVFSDRANGAAAVTDGFFVDQGNGPLGPGATPETDGNSEIEVQIQGVAANLTVVGTNQADEVRVGAGGAVNLGSASASDIDQDVDVTPITPSSSVTVFGRGGNDLLSAHGNEITRSPAPYAGSLLKLSGGPDADLLIGGNSSFDALRGDTGDDRYFAVDGLTDQLFERAGEGKDLATIDATDSIFGEIELREVTSAVGKLQLTPAALTTHTGGAARVKLGWTHPKAWKQLRTLELRASAGGKQVGAVRIDPARGRVSGRGALAAMRASTVRHHGKTVTANLSLRVSHKLAGRALRLAVQATDANGRRQLEPLAGSLTVTG